MTHKATPLSERSIVPKPLRPGGDDFEQAFYPFISREIPEYEELWRLLVWDTTCRDPVPGEEPSLSIRPSCPDHFQAFSEAHYTFLGSLVSMHVLARVLRVPSLDGTQIIAAFDHCYVRDRLLYFYVHAGRVADMLAMMVEQIGIEEGGSPLPTRLSDFEDALKARLRSFGLQQVICPLFSWWNQVRSYRSLSHKPATARVWNREPDGSLRMRILKHDRIKTLTRWSRINTRNASSGDSHLMDEAEAIEQHLVQVRTWSLPVWTFVISRAQSWREDGTFNRRLGLPN